MWRLIAHYPDGSEVKNSEMDDVELKATVECYIDDSRKYQNFSKLVIEPMKEN